MFSFKKYLWLGIVFFMYYLPTMALGIEEKGKAAIPYGDDIQSMVTLRYGSRGEDVKLIQSFLVKNGFLGDKVDGMFGSLTLQAVKDFQLSMGLPIDGVVVGHTFEALKEYKPSTVSAIKEESDVARKMVSRAAIMQNEMVNKKDKEPIVIRVNKSEGSFLPQVNLQQPLTNDENAEDTISDIPAQWRPIFMEATAYTKHDAGCTAYTYRGNYLQRGFVAVDPTVIPLGTRLYIPGYGYAIADDIGSAIKGPRIDLSMDTLDEAFAFGRRVITVYVIDWSFLA